MGGFLTKVPRAFFWLVTIAVAAIFLIFLAQPAFAAPKKGFEALQVSAPKSSFTIEPGSEKTITLEFQNIGITTWKNSGNAYVSVYTYGPKYRASIFRANNWVDYTQGALLKESSVAPQKVGTIELSLKAPLTEGEYKETFNLAAENKTWIPGGEFTLTIKVTKASSKDPSASLGMTKGVSSDGVASPVSDSGLSAMILVRSAKQITAEAGQEVQYKIGVKNTGAVIWKSREIRPLDIALAAVNTQHISWVSETKVAVKTEGEIKPGALDLIEFTFNAPNTKGSHIVKYQLAVNDKVVPDFSIDIPVEVTTGAPEALESQVTVDQDATVSTNLISEPIIRVGVLIVDEETDWTVEISCNTDWELRGGNGALFGELASNQMVRAFYKNQRYYFNRGKGIEQTNEYLRFVPKNSDGVCTVQNFDRRRTRKAGFADNQFRDVLELRYNSAKDRTWLINELPIDEYLYGLAETSNTSHQEYKKALVTVARTYALYHWERATKHASEFFHLNSTADDQVYNGYEYETRNPLIRQAVEDTGGITVNYNNATALTPYFSRSDGRTRDWSEVWGGQVEWLKSVQTPCDKRKGRRLWGHGVGMSATEALCMAEESGKNWEEILNYFYKGVALIKRWN